MQWADDKDEIRNSGQNVSVLSNLLCVLLGVGFVYISGILSLELGMSFSVNVFRLCLLSNTPHSIFTLTREMKGSHLPTEEKKKSDDIFQLLRLIGWININSLTSVKISYNLRRKGRLQKVELETNEQHCSRLRFLAQLTPPTISSLRILAAFWLEQKSNAYIPHFVSVNAAVLQILLVQMTLVMTPNDLITTPLHRWGTTSSVKHYTSLGERFRKLGN